MDGATLDDFFASCPAMLFVAGADGSLRQVSATLEQRLGHRLGDARSLASLAGPDDGPALEAFLAALADKDGEAEATCVLHPTDSEGTPLELRCCARRGSAGAIHGQLELIAQRESVVGQLEHALLRKIMDTLDIALWAVDGEGVFHFHDGKALTQAGLQRGQFLDLNIFEIYPPEIHEPIKQVFAGKSIHNLNEVHEIHWENWMVPLEMEDGSTYCAGITLNVTDRVLTQRSLEDKLDTIQTQQAAIYELSAPVLNVWDNVLAVPLIGIMDGERTDELTDRLLDSAHRMHTRFAILDLTGVEAVDTSIAAHVLRLLQSLRLLGVEGMVTGVSPEVARTMVAVGVDFESVLTHRTLREGLRHCMFELLSDT